MYQKQCKFIRKNGQRCKAIPLRNSGLCLFHNPKTKRIRKEAAINGGKSSNKDFAPLEEIKVKNHQDIVILISKVINEIRQKKIDVRSANSIFYGSGQLIKAIEIADLEERVSKLEKTFKEQEK